METLGLPATTLSEAEGLLTALVMEGRVAVHVSGNDGLFALADTEQIEAVAFMWSAPAGSELVMDAIVALTVCAVGDTSSEKTPAPLSRIVIANAPTQTAFPVYEMPCLVAD